MSRKAFRRQFTDLGGRPNVLFTPPDSWTDLSGSMPPTVADELVRGLRAAGVVLWLAPQTDGTVRCRMLFPAEPPRDMVRLLSKFARDLGKAVARSGDFNPPPDNAFGDQPLPPGGHWDWGD